MPPQLQLEIDERNAADYLRSQGWIKPGEAVRVERLSGGVSNEVFYVARPTAPHGDFVFKQARPQLRTALPWFSSIERIWREVDVMRVCRELGTGAADARTTVLTPEILHEDRSNYCFAMTAAPRQHRVWKQDLLAGRTDQQIATRCGRLLGRLHAASWRSAELAERLGDRTLFDELRLDPYYRTVAQAFPEYVPLLNGLVESVWDHRLSLVHADFTPKNLLVWDGGLMMVDFETGHFGDPAFDVGLFLAHLALKAELKRPDHAAYLELMTSFERGYREQLLTAVSAADYDELTRRSIQNFAGCTWARLDGKSRVEYLNEEPRRQRIRALCQSLLREPVAGWAEVLARLS
ncbi:MAG: phosphotransferase [Planctomycetes bacterium]|nr:phosphotransferase [Planctomycetota bacterium]